MTASEDLIVGCIMRHPGAVETCFERFVKTTDFTAPLARQIVAAAYEKLEDGEKLELAYVLDHVCETDGERGQALEWHDSGLSTAGLDEAIKTVRNAALGRQVRAVLSGHIQRAGDPLETIRQCIHDLGELEEVETPGESVSAGEIVEWYVEKATRVEAGDEEPRIKTGIKAIDATTNGYRRGTLNIIAARPKVGKSALALSIALNVARGGTPVYLLSYEMFQDDIGARLVSAVAGLDTFAAERARFSGSLDRMAAAQRELAALPLHFELEPRLSILDIPRRVRREKRKRGVEVVIVDYLQLIPDIGLGSKNAEVERVTRDLKLLSKELGLVNVAISQLNRSIEHRDDRKPRLSDLRDSGAIEQDADTVIFLTPAAVSGRRQAALHMAVDEGPLVLTVAANRSGPTGEHGIIFDRAVQRFRAQEHHD